MPKYLKCPNVSALCLSSAQEPLMLSYKQPLIKIFCAFSWPMVFDKLNKVPKRVAVCFCCIISCLYHYGFHSIRRDDLMKRLDLHWTKSERAYKSNQLYRKNVVDPDPVTKLQNSTTSFSLGVSTNLCLPSLRNNLA